MSRYPASHPGVTRRDLLRLLGAGAGLGAIAADTSTTLMSQSRPIVRTILEDISPDRLSGPTLFHEHLSSSPPDGRPTFNDDLTLMADEVKACGTDGVSCIVDAGTAGLGRKITSLREIARRSGVLIVASGGLHRKSDYPPDALRKSADQIADDLVELARTERWGAIGEMGTGTDVPTDPVERKGLQAAAKAHVKTGLAIHTHTEDGCSRCAMDQVDILEAAGADLHKVVIGHLNDITDQPAAAPIAIAKRGANLGFDHCGRPDDPRLDEYARTIVAIIDAGFADRILLGSDFGREKYLRKNGGPGIDMALTIFVPRLRRAGVPDATIHQILVENPQRVLGFVPKTKA